MMRYFPLSHHGVGTGGETMSPAILWEEETVEGQTHGSSSQILSIGGPLEHNIAHDKSVSYSCSISFSLLDKVLTSIPEAHIHRIPGKAKVILQGLWQ